MPHYVPCDEYEQGELCDAGSETAQVFGPDTNTGEMRSIYVVHECEWRLWTDEDNGWNATLHDGAHGCFAVEVEDSKLEDAPADDGHHALFTLTLFQFLLIIIGVL